MAIEKRYIISWGSGFYKGVDEYDYYSTFSRDDATHWTKLEPVVTVMNQHSDKNMQIIELTYGVISERIL